MNKLTKAFQILGELINEDCFDFWEVKNSTYDERKEYLRDMIFEYFHSGEVDLGEVIKRVDNSDYLYEGSATPETVENINNFFKDEELVADVILFMDEDIYDEFQNENNNYDK